MSELQPKHGTKKASISVGSTLPQIVKNVESRIKMQDILKPLLLSMSVFGLYFPISIRGQETKRYRVLRIYCSIVCVFLLIGVFNYTYVNNVQMVEFGPKFALHTVSYLYLVLNIISAIVMNVSCYRRNGLVLIFTTWQKLHEIPGSSLNLNAILKKTIRIVVCFSWIYYLFSIVLFSFFTIINSENDNFQSYCGILVLVWTITVYAFHIATWTFPIAFVFIISLGLGSEFRAFNKDFKKAVQGDGKFVGDFEAYRRRHQAICNLVSVFDDNFAYQFGAVLCFGVAQILLQVYVTIWKSDFDSETFSKSAMIQWIVSSLAILGLICLSGGMVNNMAHGSLSDVYDCDLDRNKNISLKIQIFLSRLTGEKIGLTAMKMFVIDKTTILTVLGLIVTYYLVLDQFQTASSSSKINFKNSTLYV